MISFKSPIIDEKQESTNNIKYYSVTDDSFTSCVLDNTFLLFKTFNDLIYLIYRNKDSIKTYNLISFQIINILKENDMENITNFRHYSDNINKRDLILYLSNTKNEIKILDVKDFTCVLKLEKINHIGYLLSACFLNDNNQIYIITSNSYETSCCPIKVFDLEGNQIKFIKNSNKGTYFIDTYYDQQSQLNYIITGNNNYSTSYNYENSDIYKTYKDISFSSVVPSIIIKHDEKIIKLIESNNDGYIRTYNFHSGELLNKIFITSRMLFGLCLIKNNFVLVGGADNLIYMIDLNKNKIIEKFTKHNKDVVTIKKIEHPKYGLCVASMGYLNDKINLWINVLN